MSSWRCCLCDGVFSDENNLDGHLVVEHLKWFRFQCYYCPYVYLPTENAALQHFTDCHPGTASKILYHCDENKAEELDRLLMSCSTERRTMTPADTPDFESEPTDLDVCANIQEIPVSPVNITVDDVTTTEDHLLPSTSNQTDISVSTDQRVRTPSPPKQTNKQSRPVTEKSVVTPYRHQLKRELLAETQRTNKQEKLVNKPTKLEPKDIVELTTTTTVPVGPPFLCEECGAMFGRSESLMHHESSVHQQTSDFEKRSVPQVATTTAEVPTVTCSENNNATRQKKRKSVRKIPKMEIEVERIPKSADITVARITKRAARSRQIFAANAEQSWLAVCDLCNGGFMNVAKLAKHNCNTKEI